MSAPQQQPGRPSMPAGSGTSGPDEKSMGDLVSSASKDLSTLLRAEVELAKLEVKDSARNAIAGAIMFAIAAVFGIFITFVLLIALGEGLVAAHIWRWAAYLIVAGVLALLAGIVALIGLRLVKKIKAPQRTIATAKDTATWAKKPTAVPPNAPAELAHRPERSVATDVTPGSDRSAKKKAKQAAADAKAAGRDAKDKAGDLADRARSAADDAAHSAASSLSDAAGTVRDKTAAAADTAKDRAGDLKEQAGEALDRGGRHRG